MLVRGTAGASSASRGVSTSLANLQPPIHRFPHAECSYRPRVNPGHKSGSRLFGSTPWTQERQSASVAVEKKKKRPSRAQVKLQDRAERFAQAMKDLPPSQEPQPSSPRDLIDLTPPTLDDFKRNLGKPRVRDHKKPYADRKKLYEDAFNRVSGAFTVKQLRELDVAQAAADGEARSSKLATKPVLMQRLMGKHEWPVPEDETADNAPDVQVFDLAANELFLFLRDTQLLQGYMIRGGVTFSVVEGGPEETGPKLQVEGPRHRLEQLWRTLEAKRRHMTVGSVDQADLHGFQPVEALTNFLALVTGAYVESHEPGFRISSMRPNAVESARKLLLLASVRAHSLPQSRQLVALHTPQSPFASCQKPNVALIPFFPSPSHLIPWESLTTSFASLLFRLKRPSQWRSGPSPSPHHLGSTIAESLVNPILGQTSEEPISLHDFLLQKRTGLVDGASISTSITFGHLVVPPSSATTSALTPPIPGELPIDAFKPFFASSSRPIFTPGLAPAMVQTPLTGSHKRLRRLTYHSRDGLKAATFIFTYPSSETDPGQGQDRQQTQTWLDRLDEMIARMSNRKSDESFDPDATPTIPPQTSTTTPNASSGESEIPEDFSGIFDAHLSSVVEIDVMMPDQPIDARFSVRTSTTLSQAQIPDGVLSFFDTFTEHLAAQRPPNPTVLDPHEAGVAQPPKVVLTPPPLEISLTDAHGAEIELALEADEDVEMIEHVGEGKAISRLVRIKDMAIGVDRIVSHSEVEVDGLDLEPLWAELGRNIRDQPETSAFSQSSWMGQVEDMKGN